MSKEFRGYIWPVTEDWGLRVFNETSGYFQYGYSRARFPKKGDFIVFYHDKHLIGSVPVIKSSGEVGPSKPFGLENGWKNDWKYAVGLNFDAKREFQPPIPIQDLTDTLRALIGKTGRQLHDACRMAPIISMNEYNSLLTRTNLIYKETNNQYSKLKNVDWIEDISGAFKNGNLTPEKRALLVSVFKRNQKLIRALKEEYKGKCQICGSANLFETDSGLYSEGHHLIPLGEKGFDVPSNLVILCPLCHKKLVVSSNRLAFLCYRYSNDCLV